jgi:hypothetical protein
MRIVGVIALLTERLIPKTERPAWKFPPMEAAPMQPVIAPLIPPTFER